MIEEQDYDEMFKVVLVGEAQAGKTSMLARYAGAGQKGSSDSADDFIKRRKPTVGVEFATCSFHSLIESSRNDKAICENFFVDFFSKPLSKPASNSLLTLVNNFFDTFVKCASKVVMSFSIVRF